ncbi:potassium channel family protein [Halobacillus sp. B23F22_1]|uniref:potassium channel family protein n=1 Tax=Halobacillus sp. B23F22_1 TaxID=3459514 RepID=UPI00373FB5C0
MLEKAGIKRAKGLIATTSDDSLNLFITLTAKGLNSEVEVIARAEVSETEDKLKRAGADHVVNPSDLGGRRMALSLIKPVSMHYIDSIIHAENHSFQMEDFHVGDQLSTSKISDLKLREKFDLTLLGIKKGDGKFHNNPDENETLQSTDVLILFGNKEHIDVFTSQSK